jgi:hypothetical protein
METTAAEGEEFLKKGEEKEKSTPKKRGRPAGTKKEDKEKDEDGEKPKKLKRAGTMDQVFIIPPFFYVSPYHTSLQTSFSLPPPNP